MHRLVKYLILFVSIFTTLVSPVNVGACGFDIENRTYRFWLFGSDVDKLEALRPYRLDYDSFTSEGVRWTQDESKEVDEAAFTPLSGIQWENIRQWQKVLPRPVEGWAIFQALYKLEGNEAAFEENDFVQALKGMSEKGFYNYLKFAKKAEKGASIYAWETVEPTQIRPNLLMEAEEALSKAPNGFLKQRYAFQLMRLGHYQNDKTLLNRIYHQYFASAPDSWLKNSAFFFKTVGVGMEERKYDQSTFGHYLMLFDKLSDKRTLIARKLPKSILDSMFSQVKSPKEKSLTRLIATLKEPARAFGQIQETYQLYPQNRFLPMLFARELNKIEDWLLTSQVTGFEATELPANPPNYSDENYNSFWQNWRNKVRNRAIDLRYLQQLHDLAEQIIEDNKQPDVGFYHLFTAHADFLLGNQIGANEHLGKLSTSLSPTRRFQKGILQTLLNFGQGQAINSNQEHNLYQFMQDAVQFRPQVMDFDAQFDNLLMYVANQYKQKGMFHKAILLQAKTQVPVSKAEDAMGVDWQNTYYPNRIWSYLQDAGSEKDAVALLKFMHKEDKSDFEKFLLNQKMLNEGDLLEIIAQFRLRRDDVEGAYRAVSSLQKSNLEKRSMMWLSTGEALNDSLNAAPLDVNPFQVNTSKRVLRDGSILYLKDVLGQYLKYKKDAEAEGNGDKGRALLKMANFQYNLTYHGNSWRVNRSWRSVNDMLNNTQNTSFEQDYFGAARAKRYYENALANTQNSQIKQIAAFMAAHCAQLMRQYQAALASQNWTPERDGRLDLSPYQRQIGTDTALLDKWVKDCSGLADFMKRI